MYQLNYLDGKALNSFTFKTFMKKVFVCLKVEIRKSVSWNKKCEIVAEKRVIFLAGFIVSLYLPHWIIGVTLNMLVSCTQVISSLGLRCNSTSVTPTVFSRNPVNRKSLKSKFWVNTEVYFNRTIRNGHAQHWTSILPEFGS